MLRDPVGQVSAETLSPGSAPGGGLGSRLGGSGLCGHRLTLWPVALLVQVNVGILIAVTRVITQISADNYKIHGDPSAFK